MSYSKFSDKIFNKTYRWRAKYFRPLLKWLDGAGIKPDDITFARLIFILPIFYYLFLEINVFAAGVYYAVFWLVDTVDGALARYQHRSSDRGKFLDIFVDTFIHSFFLVGFINVAAGNAAIIAYQILIHGTLFLVAAVKKQEGKPSDWIINPKPDVTYFKFIGNLIFGLYVFFGINIIDPGIGILNILMSGWALYYFYCLYKKER